MTEDVEMIQYPNSSIDPPTFKHLKEIASLLETGSLNKETRRISHAIRLTFTVRRKLTSHVLSLFLDHALVPGSDALVKLTGFLPKESEHEMEVDTVASTVQTSGKSTLPELEIFCYLIVLLFLIDQKLYNEARSCAAASIAHVKSLKRRVADVLASKLYSYYSLSYELTGDLAAIRGELLALHRLATLHHDELGQETLLNLLLHNYLYYNLYDQAAEI